MKISRRGFMGQTAAAGVLAAQGANRPNVLYVILEDIGPQMACYGEPLVATPHLDRFAAEGVRFTHAFNAAPVCSASRSCLMSGCYQNRIAAHQHRTWDWNKKPLPRPIRHVSEWFRDAGYFTCNLQPDGGKKAGGKLNGAAGAGKVDLNFFLDAPDKSKFFDGTDWNQRKAGQPFFAHIT